MTLATLSLRSKLAVYLTALHLVLAAACWSLLRQRPLPLFAVEAVFALSAWLGFRLVRAFFVPLDLIRTGAELIGERDWSSGFRATGQPEMDELVRIYNQMIGRLREERLKLEEQHHFLDRVLTASPAGVVTLDFDGAVSQINPSAERLLGTTAAAVVGQRLAAADVGLGAALAAIPAGEARVLPLAGGRRLKASRAEFFDRGFARGFFLLEELTEELRASEKAAYGKLIRMMAHEINNSVGAVGSLLDSFRAYAAQLDAGDSDDLLQAIAVAIQRLENLRSFTDGFAEVVRLPPPDPRPTDLGRMVDELVLLLRPELERRGIACAWTERQAVGPLAMDRNQIEQVLVNVLRNAVEAIGENGSIALSLARAGGRTVLAVRDSGGGIADDVLPLLFTPFFTTKRDGRGLGLTLVREVLAQHGFACSLGPAPGGRGAEFRMVL
jgi:two-component system nitrogen regulation sensor histidine kinase NtrY